MSGTKRKEVDSDRPPVGDDGRQRRKQSGNQSWPRAMMITRRPPEKRDASALPTGVQKRQHKLARERNWGL